MVAYSDWLDSWDLMALSYPETYNLQLDLVRKLFGNNGADQANEGGCCGCGSADGGELMVAYPGWLESSNRMVLSCSYPPM